MYSLERLAEGYKIGDLIVSERHILLQLACLIDGKLAVGNHLLQLVAEVFKICDLRWVQLPVSDHL